MEAIVRPEFGKDVQDRRVTVMHVMQAAWRSRNISLERWAQLLGITAIAAEAYISGVNTPCGDTILDALELAGCPAEGLLLLWMGHISADKG